MCCVSSGPQSRSTRNLICIHSTLHKLTEMTVLLQTREAISEFREGVQLGSLQPPAAPYLWPLWRWVSFHLSKCVVFSLMLALELSFASVWSVTLPLIFFQVLLCGDRHILTADFVTSNKWKQASHSRSSYISSTCLAFCLAAFSLFLCFPILGWCLTITSMSDHAHRQIHHISWEIFFVLRDATWWSFSLPRFIKIYLWITEIIDLLNKVELNLFHICIKQ